MPQLIFFALVGVVAYVGYQSFVREAKRVTAKVRRTEKQAANGANGTLVKDPEDRRIPACQGLIDEPLVLERGAAGLADRARPRSTSRCMSSAGAPTAITCIESLAVFTRFGDRIAIEPAPSDRFAVDGPVRRCGAARRRQSGRAARDRLRAPLAASAMRGRSRSGLKRTCRSRPASAADRAMRPRRCAR